MTAAAAAPDMQERPGSNEAGEYYFTYIDQVPTGDIRQIIETQLADTVALLDGVSEERSLFRYAPDKWSIRETVGHINDCERLFVYRAFWFARGYDSPLPSFDQNIAVAAADSDHRPMRSHLDEFRTIRAATLSLFRGLPADAWMKRGIASGNPFTVRALAYIVAGHAIHHTTILRERYRVG